MLWRLIAAAALFWTAPAVAGERDVTPSYCHAVSNIGASPPAPESFTCSGEPQDYQDRRLWLRTVLDRRERPIGESETLLVHQSRFDRLFVELRYQDGHVDRQEVARGDYGLRWRIGGQIAFEARRRDSPLSEIVLGIDRLESYPHLRTRLLAAGDAAFEIALAAAIVGAALALLGLSTLYNALLAAASRRPFIAWHAAWVGTVFLWGLFWSQLVLLAFPELAGSLASKICTLLATLAISLATACALASIDGDRTPKWARRAVLACGMPIGLLGLPAAFPPPGALPLIGSILGVLTLAVLAGVVLLLAWAWRKGDKGARDFTLAWGLPMAVLASTEIVDFGPSLLGGGSQLAVLLASALQTVWLSVAETLRLAKLREERDAANAARWEMQRLAERDPLTSLLNRRGFVARAHQALKGGRHGFTLLLIDVDHFKSVNDRYGHDVGDAVLRCVAGCIDQKAGGGAFVGRLGGEEFAIGITSPQGDAISAAFSVREAVEGLPLQHLFGEERWVTISIGVSRAPRGGDFETVYREADRALYAAKHAGRNQVALFDGTETPAHPGSRLGAAA